MELSGALLNPRLQVELPRLIQVHERLAKRCPGEGPHSRVLRRRQGSVLEAVTTVLAGAAEPLRVREIHAEVEQLLAGPVPFSSVNEALSTHVSGEQGRFRRLRYGVYEHRSSRALGRSVGNE
jgi:hypothetical protein